jgi:hypothetical protein
MMTNVIPLYGTRVKDEKWATRTWCGWTGLRRPERITLNIWQIRPAMMGSRRWQQSVEQVRDICKIPSFHTFTIFPHMTDVRLASDWRMLDCTRKARPIVVFVWIRYCYACICSDHFVAPPSLFTECMHSCEQMVGSTQICYKLLE